MTAIETYPLNVKQFIVDTLRLPPIAKAAYLMILLDYCAQGGPPSDEPEVLASIVNMDLEDWEDNWRSLVSPLFDRRDGRWHHAGVDAEIERQSKVRNNAVSASKTAKQKRDQRKGLVPQSAPVACSSLPSGEIEPAVMPVSAGADTLPAPEDDGWKFRKEALDHPLPEDFIIDGPLVIECQNRGADMGEIADWFDWFKAYHAEAGTLSTDWPAAFLRHVDKKMAEKNGKPKGKPRLELSRRAPAPPVQA